MPIDLSHLTYNDRITYTCGYTTQSGIDDQDEERGPYSSLVVDISEKLVEVRADGMHGCAPLYIVFKSDVLRIEGGQNER